MRELFADAWHLFVRGLRSTLRLPVFLVLSIVQPILWLLLFTPLMATVAAVPGFGASSYLEFVAPGIAVMAALFSSVWSGVGLLQDMERGVLDRFLATPVSRGALIGGRILNAAFQVACQAALVLAVAALEGEQSVLASAMSGPVSATISRVNAQSRPRRRHLWRHGSLPALRPGRARRIRPHSLLDT
jgi:ABC-2 type transport system permease protein